MMVMAMPLFGYEILRERAGGVEVGFIRRRQKPLQRRQHIPAKLRLISSALSYNPFAASGFK